MFKSTKATTVKEYLLALPKDRKEIIIALDKFIRAAVPAFKPYFAYNMIGYGKFKYLNYKKQLADWPVVALASQKQYISLYVCSVIDGEYVAEKHKKELGKVKVGRSCISFKKLEDINLATLKRVLIMAAKHPGFVK